MHLDVTIWPNRKRKFYKRTVANQTVLANMLMIPLNDYSVIQLLTQDVKKAYIF